MATIEDIKVYINAVISNAEKLTSGNVSHNGAAIQTWANMALSSLDEALTEQDRIARAEERERCIKAAQDVTCRMCESSCREEKKYLCSLYSAIMEGGDDGS